jgi:hypothetical protein
MFKFTSTRLVGTNKEGILKPNNDGYYLMPIGGLNVMNSAGEKYVAEGAVKLFESSSIFMRRVKSGCLYAELGHPKKLPSMTMDDYIHRILSIEETNRCAHFGDIYLDNNFGKNNPKFNNPELIAIMGFIKPSGAHEQSLKNQFDNPKEEVCFSIRALTRDYLQRGINHRVLEQIVTFDNVTEPGINIARKQYSPSLESLENVSVTRGDIERFMSKDSFGLATESTRELALEIAKVTKVNIDKSSHDKSSYLNW